jgi:hypothetical protein
MTTSFFDLIYNLIVLFFGSLKSLLFKQWLFFVFRFSGNSSVCRIPMPYLKRLIVVVEWLALLLRMLEVPGSHLGPDIGYPDLRCIF